MPAEAKRSAGYNSVLLDLFCKSFFKGFWVGPAGALIDLVCLMNLLIPPKILWTLPPSSPLTGKRSLPIRGVVGGLGGNKKTHQTFPARNLSSAKFVSYEIPPTQSKDLAGHPWFYAMFTQVSFIFNCTQAIFFGVRRPPPSLRQPFSGLCTWGWGTCFSVPVHPMLKPLNRCLFLQDAPGPVSQPQTGGFSGAYASTAPKVRQPSRFRPRSWGQAFFF
jgi:hypothetical protein